MGRPPKEKEKPPVEPTETELESQDLELSSQSMEKQAKEQLTPVQLKRLKKIAYYTAKVGLPLSEACVLVDVDPEKFKEEMKLHPIIGKIIQMKELEFKKDMLYTLTARARSGDDKLAQWLLEKKFPEEFGAPKRGSGGGEGTDVIFEAIRFIRKHGDNAPLVTEANSRPIAVIKGQNLSEERKPLPERVDDILGRPTFTILPQDTLEEERDAKMP